MKQWLAIVLVCCPAFAGANPVFEDKSDALVAHEYSGGWEHFVGGGVAVFDCNDDNLPDFMAAGGEGETRLFVNQGDFAFGAETMVSLTRVVGAYPIDVDADGRTDLFVLRAGANQILRGLGACQFEDATTLFGLPTADRWSTAFSAWWETGDKRPVFAVGNYVDRSDLDGPFEACDVNEILRPSGRGYREELLSPGFCPLSILAARAASGRLTLRLSNDRHYYVKGGFEQMWDIAEQRFLDADDGWPQVSLWGMGIATRDLTQDGRDEVMLTSMGDQLMQLAEPDGSYRAAPFSIGTYAQRPHTGGDGRPSTGWHAEFSDVDNDGLADLFIAKGNVDQMPGMAMNDPNNLLMQSMDGTFNEAAAPAGIATMARSRGAAFADFDLDGRVDLLVSNRRAPLELYRNVTPDTGHWLSIDLQQPGGNRNAIGAVVSVQTPERLQTLQRVIGGGHAGGQLLPLHVGLGAARLADISVEWPDGSTSNHVGSAGQRIVLTKP